MATKAQRDARRKAMKEKITLLVKDDESSEVQIPRFRLKPETVNKIFNMEVEYVMDEAGTVVFPDNFMWHCLPPPYKYFVFEKERFELPPDDVMDVNYIGETQVVLWNVPLACEEEELSVWLKKGLEMVDVRFRAVSDSLKEVEEKLQQNRERLENVPYMTTNAQTEAGMAEERRIVTKRLTDEKEELEKQLEALQKQFEKEKKRREIHPIKMEKVDVEEKKKIATWVVHFSSESEEDHAVDSEEWNQIKLARGVRTKKQHIKPIATTGNLPDDIPPEDEINMRGVILQRIKHGQGTYTDWEWGDSYQGGFKFGARHGPNGLLHDKIGRYDGGFENGHRFDPRDGHQVFANGDEYRGEFGYTLYHSRAPQILTYEFCDGLPHGHGGLMKFADGSTYQGEFHQGRITGQGCFENPRTGEKLEGQFLDGVLHGEGVHITPSGYRFEGTFCHGELHGHGKMTKKTTMKVEGLWDHGQPDGRCHVVFKNGDRYTGFYQDGLRSGMGTFLYQNVHEKYDRLTGKHHLVYDRAFQGLWRAGKVRGRGCHITKYHQERLRDRFDFTTKYNFQALTELPLKEMRKRRIQHIRDKAFQKAERKKLGNLQKSNLKQFKVIRRQRIKLYKTLERTLANQQQQQIDYDVDEEEEEDDDDEAVEEEEEEDEEEFMMNDDGDMLIYYDSDWFSEDEEEEEEFDHHHHQNEIYRDLHISLVDLFENPPPSDKMGHTSIKQALEHYLYKAMESKMNKIKKLAH